MQPAPASGAFAENWRAVLALGIAPIPVNAANKKPRAPWKGQDPFDAERLAGLAESRPGAALGFLTGPSGLTVLDVDGDLPRLVEAITAKHGKPGALARTPSGGFHAYYNGGQDKTVSRRVPGFKGEPVDLRSAGGLIVAPPSLGNRGAYVWLSGDLAQRASWPALDLGTRPDATPLRPGLPPGHYSGVPEGERQVFLFAAARDLLTDEADTAPRTFDWLLDLLAKVNAVRCCPPAPADHVTSAAASAWKYWRAGRCLPGYVLRSRDGGQASIMPARVKALGRAAQDVWRELREIHGRRSGGFRVVVEGIAARMSRRPAYVQAGKRELIESGELVELAPFRMTSGRRHAAIYRFRDSLPGPAKGAYPISFPGTKTGQPGAVATAATILRHSA